MTRFIKAISIFMLPILVLSGFIEFTIRNIPNDYLYKKNYLDKESENIEVLFLGSSHAYYGINPLYVHKNSFNASYISQSLDWDYRILKRYEGNWGSLKYIVIPISYFSLFYKLEETNESWRVKNYNIYYNMKSTFKISSYFELLSNKPEINIKRIEAYYLLGEQNITTSQQGWGTNFHSENGFTDDGIAAAKRHTENLQEMVFQEHLNVLESIIQYSDRNGINIVFYTPPAFHTYVENLNEKKMSQTFQTMIHIDNSHQNVIYVNFLMDTAFNKFDFYNSDHLNEIGAEKLTKKIDTLLDQNNFTK